METSPTSIADREKQAAIGWIARQGFSNPEECADRKSTIRFAAAVLKQFEAASAADDFDHALQGCPMLTLALAFQKATRSLELVLRWAEDLEFLPPGSTLRADGHPHNMYQLTQYIQALEKLILVGKIRIPHEGPTLGQPRAKDSLT